MTLHPSAARPACRRVPLLNVRRAPQFGRFKRPKQKMARPRKNRGGRAETKNHLKWLREFGKCNARTGLTIIPRGPATARNGQRRQSRHVAATAQKREKGKKKGGGGGGCAPKKQPPPPPKGKKFFRGRRRPVCACATRGSNGLPRVGSCLLCVFVWGCFLCSLLCLLLGLLVVALLFVGVFRRGLLLPRSCGVFGLFGLSGVGLLCSVRRPGFAAGFRCRVLVRCPGLRGGRVWFAFGRCRRVCGCPPSLRRLSFRCPRLVFVVRVRRPCLAAEGCGASFGASRFGRKKRNRQKKTEKIK